MLRFLVIRYWYPKKQKLTYPWNFSQQSTTTTGQEGYATVQACLVNIEQISKIEKWEP